jgi:hypothetical protein
MRTPRSALIPITAALLQTLQTFLIHPLSAQSPPAARPKCDSAEYRQFDFWVGDWVVTMAGKRAGTNLVTLEEGGCLIPEHWVGAKGGTGQSLNFYNREDSRWHQVWVSNSGEVLNLTGSYADGNLTFRGESKPADGTRLLHRLSFHPKADSTVRQFWEVSSDGGATWTSSFDGLYRKRKG